MCVWEYVAADSVTAVDLEQHNAHCRYDIECHAVSVQQLSFL